MTEKELIGKIRELRQIKPRKDWVVFTKSQILGQESFVRDPISNIRFLFQFKPAFKMAYAGLVLVFILFGVFGFSQNSLPGDFLYPLKKITERGQAIFVSEEEQPQLNLELANKRLEELTKIAETNQVKKLAPAIKEFQASISEVTRNLAKASNPEETKKIIDDIAKKTQTISSLLGAAVGEEELEELTQSSDRLYAEHLVSYLPTRTLTEEQKEVLSEMEELVGEGRYEEAIIVFNTKFDKPDSEKEETELEETEEGLEP